MEDAGRQELLARDYASRPDGAAVFLVPALTQPSRDWFPGDPVPARDSLEVEAGATFRQVLDPGDWDRSLATNARGQSGSPGGPHFSDLATLWTAGRYFPLLFSDGAVQANAESTLTLAPRSK